jgi:membrane complex biogenesis BtpA family protein
MTSTPPPSLFPPEGPCRLIGMVHALPLPGSPGWRGPSLAPIRARAVADAEALLEGGCDALLVENMHDLPYLRGAVDPSTVAAMAIVTADVVAVAARRGVPVGVQVLAAANREAWGVAVAAGAAFIRVEGFAYAHVADEGWIDASAGPLLRERRALGVDIAILADIRKKHSAHAVTADLTIEDLAHGSAFQGADGLIVTGASTGAAADLAEVTRARSAGLPVLVGSGVDPSNAAHYAAVAHGLIVGSSLKVGGDWRAPVDVARVRAVSAAMQGGTA